MNQFEADDIKQFAAIMRDWNAKGYLHSSDRISKKTDDAPDTKISIAINGAYKPGIEVLAANTSKQEMVVFPAGTSHLSTGGIIATMHAISRTSKNPERSFLLGRREGKAKTHRRI